MSKKKPYRIQYEDSDKKHTIDFSRAELKRIYNAVLIDYLSDIDTISLPKEQLLEKLNYYIREHGES